MSESREAGITVEIAPKDVRKAAHAISRRCIADALVAADKAGIDHLGILSVVMDQIVQILIQASPDEALDYITLTNANCHADIKGNLIDRSAAVQESARLWGAFVTAARLRAAEPEGSA